MINFEDFWNRLYCEARFTSIENDITEPEVTKEIQKWIRDIRKTYNLTDPSKVQDFVDLVNKEEALLLGTMQVGRKTVNIWIQEMANDGLWVERPKKASYILVSVSLIVNNPNRALSTIVHELIHGIQKYREQSAEYNLAASKTEDETEQELFDYFTEPKEIEAQLGQMAHVIVSAYRNKRNKESMLETLEYLLRLPREAFLSDEWLKKVPYLNEYERFLRSISKPPLPSLRNQQISDKCWRQFKQKLFNLAEQLKNK